MSPETLEALKKSIEKWEKNCRVRKPSSAKIWSDTCPLCTLFNPDDAQLDTACIGCPVMEATGLRACNGTPWGVAHDALHDWHDARWKRVAGSAEAFHAAARAEVDFLKSLLPEEVRS